MQKIYQSEWFGIHFSDFACPSRKRLAGPDFYAEFYRQFYRKYQSYDQLPYPWRASKLQVVAHLAEIIRQQDARRILSIGCGNGFIERELLNKCAPSQCISLVAVEPNISAAQWLTEPNLTLLHGYFPDVVEGMSFDFAYASNLDYCFGPGQYEEFLNAVRAFGLKHLLLTDIPLDYRRRQQPVIALRCAVRAAIRFLGMDRRAQLWGYLRTWNEHLNAVALSGWKLAQSGRLLNGNHWILAAAGESRKEP